MAEDDAPTDTDLDRRAKSTDESHRARWLAPGLGVAVLIIAGALLVAFRPRASSPVDRMSLRTCGPVPVSIGADAPRLALTVAVPATARSGSTIAPTAQLRATGDAIAVTDGALPVEVVIVKDGRVVGAYRGAVGGTGFGGHIGRDQRDLADVRYARARLR